MIKDTNGVILILKYGYDRYSDYYRRNISLEEPKYREAYNYFGHRQAGSCRNRKLGAYDTSWDIDDGLAFFSKKLAEQDFKTEGTMLQVKAGTAILKILPITVNNWCRPLP